MTDYDRDRLETLDARVEELEEMRKTREERIAELESELGALSTLLPSTYYADRPLSERLALLISHWQRSLPLVTQLDEQLAVERERVQEYQAQLVALQRDTAANYAPKCEVVLERERAEKAGAEMREALLSSSQGWKKMADGLDHVKSEGDKSVELGCEVAVTFRQKQSECERALSADAGRDYHHRDEFKPLVAACEVAHQAWLCNEDTLNLLEACRLVSEALADARSKGLIS